MRVLPAILILLLAQSPEDKLEAALKKFGERNYKILKDSKENGIMTLKTRVEEEGETKVAVFEDRVEMKAGEAEISMSLIEKASLKGLRLISGKRTGKVPGGQIDWWVSVAEGKASLRVDDRQQTIDVTEGTVAELAVLRLVCAAEQKVGESFKADVLVMVAERVDRGHEFKCVAKETLEIGGAKRDAYKWEETWEGTMTINGKTGTSKTANTYWAGSDGYPLRAILGPGMEVVLDVK
jgi:hypothetical protein